MKQMLKHLLLCYFFSVLPISALADPFADLNITPVTTDVFAPEFNTLNLNGNKTNLSDYAGNVVLLNFWATWCSPCRREMPDMEKLWQRYQDSGFVVVGMSNDEGDKRKRIATFIKKVKLSFPILLDPDSKISDLYDVSGIPVSFLINREGKIVAKIVGTREWASPEAFALIEQLL